MSDPTPTTEPDEIAAAQADLEQAQALVGQVEDQLLDGKPGVGTADLLQAEDLVNEKRSLLDRARQISAGRKARADEKARQARIAELRATVTLLHGSTEFDVSAAFDQLADAAEAFVAQVGGYNDQLTQLIREFAQVDYKGDANFVVSPGQILMKRLGPDGTDELFVTAYDTGRLLQDAAWLGAARATGDQNAVPRPTESIREANPAGTEPEDAVGLVLRGVHWRSNLATAARRRARLLTEGGQR